MGKPTGFMDYKRQELALRPPQERIKDWEEIKTSSLPHKEELQKQAARCMDCSIPFCHSGVMLGKALSGCPLHNLMPEFNDFVYQGLDHFAYARLNKTNNFPEFTSHVCPAPVKEPAVPAWQAVRSVSAILNNISLKQHLQKAMSNPTSRLTAAAKKLPLSAAARPAWPVLTSLTRQATALPFMNVPTAPAGF